jgi:hypothetical protein
VSLRKRHVVAVFALLLAFGGGAVAQQAPASGTYAIPSGWKRASRKLFSPSQETRRSFTC